MEDILRAAGTADDTDETPNSGSALLGQVVMPALAQAEHAFSTALSQIFVEDLVRSAGADLEVSRINSDPAALPCDTCPTDGQTPSIR